MSLQNLDLVHALAHVQFSGAGVPSYGGGAGQQKGFDGSVAIVDNGPGDITLTLKDEVGADQVAIFANRAGALAASGLVAIGWTMPTLKTIRVTILNEGAAGAVSALTDLDFDILVMKYPQG